MRTALIIVVIVGSILGYGFWHSSTHASFHVQINFKDFTREKPRKIHFLNSDGHVLAKGIIDEQYNYVHFIHPVIGDCHEVEQLASFSKEAKKSWQECFEQLSTWIPKWVNEVRQIELIAHNCIVKNVPVKVSKSNLDWILWWVPHPHIGGKPYSHYSLSIAVKEKNCII